MLQGTATISGAVRVDAPATDALELPGATLLQVIGGHVPDGHGGSIMARRRQRKLGGGGRGRPMAGWFSSTRVWPRHWLRQRRPREDGSRLPLAC